MDSLFKEKKTFFEANWLSIVLLAFFFITQSPVFLIFQGHNCFWLILLSKHIVLGLSWLFISCLQGSESMIVLHLLELEMSVC